MKNGQRYITSGYNIIVCGLLDHRCRLVHPGSTAEIALMKPSGTSFDSLPSHSLMPVLPLRDVVVYPHMVIPLFVGRETVSYTHLDVYKRQDPVVVGSSPIAHPIQT